MGVILRLLPVIVLLAIVGAVYWFAIRPRRRPAKPVSRGPAVESLSPPTTTPAPVRATVSATAPAEKPAADGDGELSVKQVWTDLCSLLRGEGTFAAQKAFVNDGRLNHRSGMRFTIFHGDDVYVIVRAVTDSHESVRRFVISKKRPTIMLCTEPRVALAGSTRGITRSQAANISTDGMREADGEADLAELAFLQQEVAAAYRMGELAN